MGRQPVFQGLEKAAEKVPSAVAKAMAGQEDWKKQEWESPRGAKAAESLIRTCLKRGNSNEWLRLKILVVAFTFFMR